MTSAMNSAEAGLIGGLLALFVALWALAVIAYRQAPPAAQRTLTSCVAYHTATARDTVWFEVVLAPRDTVCTITLRRP